MEDTKIKIRRIIMQKRIVSFLLAVVMVFGVNTGNAFAGQAAKEEMGTGVPWQAVQETDDGPLGAERGMDKAPDMPTGFQPLIEVEVSPEEVTERYEPSRDIMETRGSAVYRSVWDSYSTNYYYNMLNDAQRVLWDNLDQMCHEYLTGTETLTDSDTYVSSVSGLRTRYYRTKSIVYRNLSRNEAYDVMFMFVLSNPQYYFLQSIYGVIPSNNAGIVMLSVNEAFADGAARMMVTQQLGAIINSWMQQINAEPTALLKEKKIHDMICKKVTYDPYYNKPAQNQYNQTIYSVFFTDTTVCAGYSQAMQLLCNAAGIDCAVVTSEEHEWNIVRLNGTWYNVDCTWDDNIADDAGWDSSYFYFNRSTQAYMSDSNPYNVASHVTESMWDGYLPQLIYDSGATDTEYGSIYTPAGALAAPVISAVDDKVTLTSPSGGVVYYTTDGTDPSIAATKAKRYTGAITLSGVTVVRAVAVANAFYDSGVTGATVTPQYSIKLNANGGYIGKKSVKAVSKTIVSGNQIGKIADPKRKGYAFMGWYTAKSGGSKVSASTYVSSSGTYYARWAKIKPGKVGLSSVKNVSGRAMKIKIKKSDKASGYMIRYSTNKNMSGAKNKETKDTSLTIKKLGKGKTYYVQARMYQKNSVSGKKSYGPWSKAKTVRIKK